MNFSYAMGAGFIGWVLFGIVPRRGPTLIEVIVVVNVLGILAGKYLSGKNGNWLLEVLFVLLFCVLPYALLILKLRQFLKKRNQPHSEKPPPGAS